ILDTIGSVLIMALMGILMITQLLIEVRHGMANASPATKNYFSAYYIIFYFQGIVPNAFVIGPAFCLLGLYLYMRYVGTEISSANLTAISVMSMNVMSLHAFAHSLTVLAYSPSY
ncbi:hypothetical protein PENTCL1PPCAC_24915, partial [Pristionchus entomophagus]